MAEEAGSLEERKIKTLSLIRGEQVERPAEAPIPKAMVWPHLLAIEFLAMMICTIGLLVFSVLRNAPLKELANPDVTPNPSKAPWYLVGLQELLLHMDPFLAALVLPGVAFALLAIIPYIDFQTAGTGHWFNSAKGVKITIFSTVYSVLILVAFIVFDSRLGGVPGTAGGIRQMLKTWGVPDIVGTWILPVAIMLGLSALLVLIVRLRWQANLREIIIALFTGFVVVFFLTSLVGFLFRGPSQALYWPWDMGCTDLNYQDVSCDAPGAIRYDPLSEF